MAMLNKGKLEHDLVGIGMCVCEFKGIDEENRH